MKISRWVAVGLLFCGSFSQAAVSRKPSANHYPVTNYNSPNSSQAGSQEQPFLGGIEFGMQYPAVLGLMGQNFNAGVGAHGTLHFNFLGDFRAGLYLGYQNLPLRVDTTTSFRLIPVLAQVGVEGRTTFDWLYTSFDVGVGGAMGWLNTPGAAEFRSTGYFAFQLQPGLEFAFTDMFSMVFHMPVLYVFGSKPMGFISYDGGVKINL